MKEPGLRYQVSLKYIDEGVFLLSGSFSSDDDDSFIWFLIHELYCTSEIERAGYLEAVEMFNCDELSVVSHLSSW